MYKKGNKHNLEFTCPLKISSQIGPIWRSIFSKDIKDKGMQNAGGGSKKGKIFTLQYTISHLI